VCVFVCVRVRESEGGRGREGWRERERERETPGGLTGCCALVCVFVSICVYECMCVCVCVCVCACRCVYMHVHVFICGEFVQKLTICCVCNPHNRTVNFSDLSAEAWESSLRDDEFVQKLRAYGAGVFAGLCVCVFCV